MKKETKGMKKHRREKKEEKKKFGRVNNTDERSRNEKRTELMKKIEGQKK